MGGDAAHTISKDFDRNLEIWTDGSCLMHFTRRIIVNCVDGDDAEFVGTKRERFKTSIHFLFSYISMHLNNNLIENLVENVKSCPNL